METLQSSDRLQLVGQRLFARVGEQTVELPLYCPHKGAPLAEAELNGPFLRCIWHGATFDMRTGRRLRGPACDDLLVCPVRGVPEEC